MKNRKPQQARRTITAKHRAQIQRHRLQIARELPDLIDRNQMRKEALDEPTLSGELRRAINSTALPIAAIAARAEITPIMLDEFLTGERTLRSDVLDRLAKDLALVLQPRA